jgi:hypothetical protein
MMESHDSVTSSTGWENLKAFGYLRATARLSTLILYSTRRQHFDVSVYLANNYFPLSMDEKKSMVEAEAGEYGGRLLPV